MNELPKSATDARMLVLWVLGVRFWVREAKKSLLRIA